MFAFNECMFFIHLEKEIKNVVNKSSIFCFTSYMESYLLSVNMLSIDRVT